MKNSGSRRGCGKWFSLAALAAYLMGAGPVFGLAGFGFAPRDVVIGFRQVGGSYEMVVDLGPATNFYYLAPGSVTSITSFSQTTLNYAFSDLGGVSWSAVSSVTTGQSLPNQPVGTLWATEARTDTNVQTPTFQRESKSLQGASASAMYSVGNSAKIYANNNLTPNAIYDTPTSVVYPAGNPYSYSVVIGPNGDFNGVFLGGDVENTTPDDFGRSPSCVVSDFYELQPDPTDALPGVYHGFFTLHSDGAMTFTAAYGAPPVLTSVSPSTGALVGGTTVTLTGSGFINGRITVEFGGVLATDVQFVNATTVTAVVPAGAAGATDVLAANSDGQSSDLAAAFTYQAAATPSPGISSITRSGGNIVIVSTNAANASLSLCTSTNATAFFTSWTSLNTNSVGADGRWTNTYAIKPGEPQRYFILAIP